MLEEHLIPKLTVPLASNQRLLEIVAIDSGLIFLSKGDDYRQGCRDDIRTPTFSNYEPKYLGSIAHYVANKP